MNLGADELLIRVSRRAMASEFEVCFPAGTCENGTKFALESLDLVESMEKRLSYFRSNSEIDRINRQAAGEPVEVAPDLFDLLLLATRLNKETAGAYDIASAPLWDAWGFARRKGQIPTDVQLAEARSNVGGHLIELDPMRRTIRFLKPGVKINLGSIGKGYALDVCADRLLSLGMKDFLLHGGQSSVLARGSRTQRGRSTPRGLGTSVPSETGLVPSQELGISGGLGTSVPSETGTKKANPTSSPSPWEIGVCHPLHPQQRLGHLHLHNRALGTSSGQFQSFRRQGRRYGHILDPRSGWPAEGVLSTTVVAPTAALADALSTAFYILGAEPSLAYCRNCREIGLLMFCPGQSGGDVEVHRAGLDEMTCLFAENEGRDKNSLQ